MLHWTIWGREPGVHEASLRRYGSKLVYHITVYVLFTLVTVTCKYSVLTQLTYHFASYNSCSNWRPPTTMHRHTRLCRNSDKYPWCLFNNWPQGPQDPYLSGASPMGSVKPIIQTTRGIFVRVRQNLVRRYHDCIKVGGRQFEQLLKDAKWYVNCVNILY